MKSHNCDGDISPRSDASQFSCHLFRLRSLTIKTTFRSSVLEEVQNQGNTKLPSNKNVLVLGDNETGKTTLVAKLQGVEDPKKGSALEYAYIDVRDEYRDGKCYLLIHYTDCVLGLLS